MSWFYNRALPWVLPQVLLMARPSSEVVIVSPWMDNVLVHPPRRAGGHPAYTAETTRIGELLRDMAVRSDVRVLLIVRDEDERLARATRLLSAAKPSNLQVISVPKLHAKAVVTEAFVLGMSANVLHFSVHENIETCSLHSNPFGTARQWVRQQLNISV
jgi:hypothetical protein